VVREARNLPEAQKLEKTTAPKSKWQSRGMIGALVAGAGGIAGAFGFVLAPEEIDAMVGLISNAIAVGGAVMAWFAARTPPNRLRSHARELHHGRQPGDAPRRGHIANRRDQVLAPFLPVAEAARK
jgi:hypothetical protein